MAANIDKIRKFKKNQQAGIAVKAKALATLKNRPPRPYGFTTMNDDVRAEIEKFERERK